jgi:hypothetical protein
MTGPLDLSHLARVADELDTLLGGDDERLFHDMITGETDIDHIARRVWEHVARDAEILAGIGERQNSLKDRKARIEARYDAGKAFIGKLLRAAHLPKLELPEVTLSVRDGKPSLKVVDPLAVPLNLCRQKAEPDKAAINEKFAAETSLPNWLVREAARDVVTARTK